MHSAVLSAPRTRGSSGARTTDECLALVGPAHAGVILGHEHHRGGPRRRPRARGGHPMQRYTVRPCVGSAPRTRGSSVPCEHHCDLRDVGPAHAGVIPRPGPSRMPGARRPRARGGHPATRSRESSDEPSAPRTRGSSADAVEGGPRAPVGPAHAGVIRSWPAPEDAVPSRPRARGGHPAVVRWMAQFGMSAPRTRGSSGGQQAAGGPAAVGPAHAGVIRRTTTARSWRRASAPRTRGSSVVEALALPARAVGPAHAGVIPGWSRAYAVDRSHPRARGGHPDRYERRLPTVASAPRTRGSSLRRPGTFSMRTVGPAHAGVILMRSTASTSGPRRPRARGGHPDAIASASTSAGSAPRTRGSSEPVGGHERVGSVGPAHAGVIRMGRSFMPLTPVGPAHAGVIRSSGTARGRWARRPRARGGHPWRCGARGPTVASAPRTRGSSLPTSVRSSLRLVGPAHAGVIPSPCRRPSDARSRPRARGGHPFGDTTELAAYLSAPRTRGSSAGLGERAAHHHVGPAHAGVIRTARCWKAFMPCRPRARGGHPSR